ncbi:MAG: hypothetical protein GY906_40165 [bacterium]|nr:hypothetical protein [bacterium]
MSRRRRTAVGSFLTTAFLCATLVIQVKPILGGPGSVLNAIDPLRSAPAQETRALDVGDMTVASRTGAFEYSYPIVVPPGRLGNQPSLALTYSSQGALRGGIAAGWSLNIPEISLEFPEGRSPDGPTKGGVYVSSMSGGHRLVEVEEPVISGVGGWIGFQTAYRAEYDDQYIRYSIDPDDDAGMKAVAMTLDGMAYFFGGRFNLGLDLGALNHAGRWPLTSALDRFGNVVDYHYGRIEGPVPDQTEEFYLDHIEYGENNSAELEHHAKLEFDFVQEPPCGSSTVAPGAKLDHRWEWLRTRGARKLHSIRTMVKDAPGGDYRTVRIVVLNYHRDAESCVAQHGPLRLLSSITEYAPKKAGDTNPGDPVSNPTKWTSEPPVSFDYGPLARSWKDESLTPTGLFFLGKGSRTRPETGTISMKWPTLDDMLLDLNGDGIVDRLTAKMPSAGNGFQCQMDVRLGDGTLSALSGAIEATYDLPTLPWAADNGPPIGDEACSLSGQHTYRISRDIVDESKCSNLGGYLAYRFMDMNADGLPDLVTELSSDPLWWMGWDPNSGVDNSDLDPFDPSVPGACPIIHPDTLAPTEDCPVRDFCRFDQGELEVVLDGADTEVCGVLMSDNHPHHVPPPTFLDTLAPLDPPPPPEECPWDQKRSPQIHNGRYVWRWYKNVDGVLSSQRQLTMSPIPLTANSGDSGFGNGPLSSSSLHGLFDITGDGFMDAIARDAASMLASQEGLPPGDIYDPKSWYVWPGDGQGNFTARANGHPLVWHVPYGAQPSGGRSGKFWSNDSPGDPDYFVGGHTTLKDVNGDGLVDLLKVEGPPAELYVFLNTGAGFRSDSSFAGAGPPTPSVAWRFRTTQGDPRIDWTNFDVSWDTSDLANGSPEFLPEADRHSRLMIVDTDGDGLPDVHSKGTHQGEGENLMYYGLADGRLLAPRSITNDAPERMIRGNQHEWFLKSDYLDINGDGVMDQLYESNNQIFFLSDDFGDEPMRLMRSVNNGNGLTTDIRYAPNNSAEVAIDPDDIKGMPNHVWIVKSVGSTESLPTGYATSPDSITEVKYGAPVWNEDNHGHWGFRGFETIQTSSLHEPGVGTGFSVTEQQYDFNLDWSGRLKETVLYVDGFPSGDGSDAVVSISRSQWIERAVTGGLSLSYVKNREITRDCETATGSFQNESICATRPITDETRFWHKYYRHYKDTTGPFLMSRGYRSWETPTGYHTSYVRDESILNQQGTRLYSDEVQYHAMTTSEVRYRGNGTDHEMVAKTERTPDSSGRYFADERVYVGGNWQNSLLTDFQRDDLTGHLTSRQKPEQYPSGPKETYAYSGFKVVASSVTNELQQTTVIQTDLGTGKPIVTRTPNTINCASGVGPEGTQINYDGFGRPIELFEYGCNTNDEYAPIRVKRIEYTEYDSNSPTSVRTHALISYSGAEAESESYFDGYGRLIRTRSQTDNGNTNVIYEYGVNGKVRRHKNPNPAHDNDSEKSEFTYQYDSLGRRVGMRVPDASGVSPDPDAASWDNFVGIDVSYALDGSETVTRRSEHVLDGSAASETTTYHNNFGQLTRVDERLDDGTVAATWYGFDGNGNLSNINDADGFRTTMQHDGVSRRTKIVRGGREWSFEYDLNSNVVLETTPMPDGAHEADHQTSHTYDDLDRVTRVVSGPRDLSATEQELLGVNLPTVYTYDTGFNAIGRISSVEGPFYERHYTYDFAGRVTSEQFVYDISSNTEINGEVAANRTHSFEYNAAGAPTNLMTADSMRLQYEYDSAGRQKRVWWQNSNLGNLKVAQFTRNAAGGVTRRRSGCVEREWEYDQLGRVTHTNVRKNPNLSCDTSGGGGGGSNLKMQEDMGYFDSNEVETQSVLREGIGSRTFTYEYDSQHQLLAASDNLGEYDASFAYWRAGRPKTARVNSAGGAPLVNGRDVDYNYGDHETVDAHAVAALTNIGGGLNTSYSYDLSGNVVRRHHHALDRFWEFRYDGDDRQRIVTAPGGNDEIYYYDENGQRFLSIERDSDGVVARSRFWYGDSEFWFDGTGQVEKRMTNIKLGGSPVARIDNDPGNPKDLEYSFHNGLGHLMGAVETNGTLTTTYVYGPYGEILEESGETSTHLRRFNGKEADQISHLNYYGYRYYDPLSLQWTQADPLYRVAPDIAYDEPRLMSLYAFSLNNPVRYLDPDGLGSTEWYVDNVVEPYWESDPDDGDVTKTGKFLLKLPLGAVITAASIIPFVADDVGHSVVFAPLIHIAIDDNAPEQPELDLPDPTPEAPTTPIAHYRVPGYESPIETTTPKKEAKPRKRVKPKKTKPIKVKTTPTLPIPPGEKDVAPTGTRRGTVWPQHS